MQLQHQTTIDGLEITSTLLDYDDAADISAELIQKMAPLVEAFSSLGPDDLTAEGLNAAALPAVSSVARNMKPAEWAALMRRLFERTSAICTDEAGKKINVDLKSKEGRNIAFRGNVLASYKVALFVIKINFADFIGALGPLGITVKGL